MPGIWSECHQSILQWQIRQSEIMIQVISHTRQPSLQFKGHQPRTVRAQSFACRCGMRGKLHPNPSGIKSFMCFELTGGPPADSSSVSSFPYSHSPAAACCLGLISQNSSGIACSFHQLIVHQYNITGAHACTPVLTSRIQSPPPTAKPAAQTDDAPLTQCQPPSDQLSRLAGPLIPAPALAPPSGNQVLLAILPLVPLEQHVHGAPLGQPHNRQAGQQDRQGPHPPGSCRAGQHAAMSHPCAQQTDFVSTGAQRGSCLGSSPAGSQSAFGKHHGRGGRHVMCARLSGWTGGSLMAAVPASGLNLRRSLLHQGMQTAQAG